MPHIFDQDLPRNEANFTPLSPLSFIERTAEVYPQRLAVIDGDLRSTWSELYGRCRRLASALAKSGVGKGDTVAVMLPNTPPMVEAHFGIPMAGAVLNAMNTRLDAQTIAFMLDHGEAKAVIVDPECTAVMKGYWPAQGQAPAAGRRRRRRAVHGCRRACRDHRLRGLPGRRRRRFRMEAACRRMGRDRAELHERHHGKPQGRRLQPPGGDRERDLQHSRMGHAQACRVPVDAAHVPLQRLVLSLDRRGARRRECVPAQGREGQGRPRRDQGAWRDALLRRTHRAGIAGQRTRRNEEGPAERSQGRRRPVPPRRLR